VPHEPARQPPAHDRILRHFASRQRWFLVPLLLVLLCAGVLLIATGGLSFVAPFIYSIF